MVQTVGNILEAMELLDLPLDGKTRGISPADNLDVNSAAEGQKLISSSCASYCGFMEGYSSA
jgi:hypothetical protein